MRLKLPQGSVSLLAFLLGAVPLAVLPGCGGDEPIDSGNTPPDESRQDAGDPGSPANDTGEGSATEGEGNTGPAPTNSTTTSPTTSTSGSETTPSTEGPVGTAIGIECTEDSDCLPPLTCVSSDPSFRGSIPGTGICTIPCTGDDQCQAVDLLGVCETIGAPTAEALAAATEDELPEGLATFCQQACPFGLAVAKCDSLATFTCAPLEDTVTALDDGTEFQFGVCAPLCGGDDDCSDGEFCDPAWGMCLPTERPGKDLGELCDPAIEADCKSGFCLGIAEELDFGICSQPCNFHPDTVICGDQSAAEYGCYPYLFAQLSTTGNDIGQCLPLCDEDADCPSGLACDTTETEVFQDFYGRSGMCFPTDASIGEALGGADAGAPPAESTQPDSTSQPVGDAG